MVNKLYLSTRLQWDNFKKRDQIQAATQQDVETDSK